MITQKHNDSIDFLKLIATLLIINSHMDISYENYKFLATGGAIGDSLFFFISGFTLYLGRRLRFEDWYKKRINRIYPSLLATGIISAVFFGYNDNFLSVFTAKRYWFIRCIFFYYLLLYPVKMYCRKPQKIFVLYTLAILIIYFLFFDYKNKIFFNEGFFWSDGYFLRFLFFLFMLQGAIIGRSEGNDYKWWHLPLLFICIVSWYGIQYLLGGTQWLIISVIPMFGITYSFYMIGNAPLIKKLYPNKIIGNIIYIIGNLCLECYLIQFFIISDIWNHIFPLNIPLTILVILVISYAIHIFAEIIRQVFNSDPFRWKNILLYKKTFVSPNNYKKREGKDKPH